MILESKGIPFEAVDITDPSQEEAKDWVVSSATPKPGAKIPITPQIYNEDTYCGDFDQLDMANECDILGEFLKLDEAAKGGIKMGITSGGMPGDQQHEDLMAVMGEGEAGAQPQEEAQLANEETAPHQEETMDNNAENMVEGATTEDQFPAGETEIPQPTDENVPETQQEETPVVESEENAPVEEVGENQEIVASEEAPEATEETQQEEG